MRAESHNRCKIPSRQDLNLQIWRATSTNALDEQGSEQKP
jgi:hypothetical protein